MIGAPDPGGRRPCRIPRARCERYLADGLSRAEIAALEGWSVSAVGRHRAGLGLRYPSRALVRTEDILSVLAGRETVREVADRLGVTPAAVHMRASRDGIPLGRVRRAVQQLDLFKEAA